MWPFKSGGETPGGGNSKVTTVKVGTAEGQVGVEQAMFSAGLHGLSGALEQINTAHQQGLMDTRSARLNVAAIQEGITGIPDGGDLHDYRLRIQLTKQQEAYKNRTLGQKVTDKLKNTSTKIGRNLSPISQFGSFEPKNKW